MSKRKPKTHEIRTVEDMSKAVNSENLDDFLFDLSKVLYGLVTVRERRRLSAKKVFMTSIKWTDDGKHDVTITRSKDK
jgi:hypothetical protein